MSPVTPAATGRHTHRPVRRDRPDPVVRTVVRRQADGTELGPVDLEPTVFGIQPNAAVLHQVVTAQLAAGRAGTQSTKTRAEVRGGGAKPFRQKGTGRARQGSTRSPQWVGGGIALGPKPRSYRQRTPKKMVRLALSGALSDRAASSRVVVVDRWPWDAPRTKDARQSLQALGLSGRVLIVLAVGDDVAERSFRNLPAVDVIHQSALGAYDVLRSDWIVFTDATLPGPSATAAPGDALLDGGPDDGGPDNAGPDDGGPDDGAASEGDPTSEPRPEPEGAPL